MELYSHRFFFNHMSPAFLFSFFFFCVCQVNVAPARKSSGSNFVKDGGSVPLLQMGADQRGEGSKLV